MSAAIHRSSLVDEELADLVWALWDRGVIDDDLAEVAWLLLAA